MSDNGMAQSLVDDLWKIVDEFVYLDTDASNILEVNSIRHEISTLAERLAELMGIKEDDDETKG